MKEEIKKAEEKVHHLTAREKILAYEIPYGECAETLTDYILENHVKGWGTERQRDVMTYLVVKLKQLRDEPN